MFSLSICFGPQGTIWAFMFRTLEAADKAWSSLAIIQPYTAQDIVGVRDDFGQEGTFRLAEIHGRMLEDLDKSKLAHVERQLHQARTHADAQAAARSDPKLMAMMRQAQPGPGVITSFGQPR